MLHMLYNENWSEWSKILKYLPYRMVKNFIKVLSHVYYLAKVDGVLSYLA